MKKIVLKKLGLLLIFLLGCLVFTYPFYSNAANYFIDQYRLKELAKREQIENSQKENQMKKKNNAIKVNGLVVQHDPFDASQVDTTSIDLKEHLIGSVSIPKIDVSIPLFDTITNQILENGAGVLQGTSMPTGGKGTHSVISAHRGLAERLLFRHLDQLKKEDFFLVESVGKTLAYEVIEIRTVKPDETDFLKLEPESDLVTLLTCTPYMINSHRLIVTGKRIPVTDEMKKEANASQKKFKWQQVAIIVGIGLYKDFTQMSAGQPRPTQKKRFRQRFMHKMVYFPDNNDGLFGCVGCGRCLKRCPIHMNIVKVSKALKEETV